MGAGILGIVGDVVSQGQQGPEGLVSKGQVVGPLIGGQSFKGAQAWVGSDVVISPLKL